MKGWGSLSRQRTAGDGRGAPRADEPIKPKEQPTRPAELRRLLTTFGYLVAKQGATAVLGLGYWAVATHLFSAADVGLAAAASSAAFFLAAIGALGIPLLLLAELHSLPSAARRVAFSTGTSIACFVVLILSLATLALSPFLGDSLSIIGHDWTTAVLFVIGSVATVGGLTLDNVAIKLHRGSVQLTRGILNSSLKLAVVGVLILVGTRTAPGLLFAWAVALAVSLVVCIPMLRFEPGPGRRRGSQPSGRTRPPLRDALAQAPRPESFDQFHWLLRRADRGSPDLPAATGLLLDRVPVVVDGDDRPVPADAVAVRRDVRRRGTPPPSRPPDASPRAGPVWRDPRRRGPGGSPRAAHLRPRLRHERDHCAAPASLARAPPM